MHAPVTVLAPSPARRPVKLRRMCVEMGTLVVVEARATSLANAEAAVAAAFAEAAQLARQLDPWTPQSDLWRLNRASAPSAVPISVAALEVLRFAQRVSQLSEGFFDPCLPTQPGRITDLELIDGEPRAIVHRPLELDCGGIAKGYVVDAAIGVLQKAGCSAGLVNAGGDLRTFGVGCEPLLLRGPAGTCRPLGLEDGAVAVSDRDMRRAPCGHRGYYVRSGRAAARRFAAVHAPDAMTADALTKCLLLAPTALNESLLKELRSESLV
jgi:FAD:protein FMN transferase